MDDEYSDTCLLLMKDMLCILRRLEFSHIRVNFSNVHACCNFDGLLEYSSSRFVFSIQLLTVLNYNF